MKTKNNTEELVPIYDIQNVFNDGGRKTHILNLFTSRCLCGYNPWYFVEIDTAQDGGLVGYVSKDPDGNLCLRCKEFAKRKLKIKEDRI